MKLFLSMFVAPGRIPAQKWGGGRFGDLRPKRSKNGQKRPKKAPFQGVALRVGQIGRKLHPGFWA